MKIRIAASVTLLLLVVIGGITCAVNIDKLCSSLIFDLQSSADNMSSEHLNRAKQRWDNKTMFMSALIPHEHVDSVSASMDRAFSFLSSGDEHEFRAEISEIIRQLKIVREYDIPTVRSIF